MRIIIFVIAFAISTSAMAQKNLVPVSNSVITGIDLPQGSKLDKRLLNRIAAKATMDLEANDAGIALSDNYEVFLLPPSTDNNMSDAVITNLENANWKLTVSAKDNKWGWLEKAGTKCMIYFDGKEKESWLYLAVVAGSKPVGNTSAVAPKTSNPKPAPAAPAGNNPAPVVEASKSNLPFQFTTTNFDDGWIATEKPDWIEVTKNSTTVLLHYANKAIDVSSADSKTITANAWDVLVAPRYKGMSNFYLFGGNMSYNRTTAVSANMTDHAGRSFYVVLFRKGTSNWMEFITPDKAIFEKQFGMNISAANNENLIYSEEAQWESMLVMQNRNKFAISATDLRGTWKSDFGGSISYVNVYTGASAGTNTSSSVETFAFGKNNTYNWEIKTANGYVGSINYQGAKSSGTFAVPNNWQVSFSDIEGKAKAYNAQFTCVKGARILWLDGTGFGKVQ